MISSCNPLAAKEYLFFFTNMFVFQIDLYQLRVIKTPQLLHSPNKHRRAHSATLIAPHMAPKIKTRCMLENSKLCKRRNKRVRTPAQCTGSFCLLLTAPSADLIQGSHPAQNFCW